MKPKGFTLIELIIVLLIISILAAITFPIYRSAVSKAKETTCKSQLHQIQLAIALYRTQNDGDGRYGRAEQMGLPSGLRTLLKSGMIDPELKNCKGDPSLMGGSQAVYMVMWAWHDADLVKPSWETYSQDAKEASILLADPNHRNNSLHVGSPYYTHFLLGVYLDGQVVSRKGKGSFTSRNWWSK